MLGLLGDIAKIAGSIVGTVVGPIVGISVSIVANTLGISIAMVNEATRSGCKSYEEIRNFHNL